MKKTHGYGSRNKNKTYVAWCSMKRRCLNSKSSQYVHYGGRGITVCEGWMKFEKFLFDMGDKPPGMTLDRKDTNGNYNPSNCRWATKKEQCNNRRNNSVATFNGKTQTITAWSEELGFKDSRTLFARLYLGWTTDRTLSTPAPA